MADKSDKEKLDKAHQQGYRDGAAGGDRKPPRSNIYFIPGTMTKLDHEENDAYDRGHAAGKKNRSK
jgi:ribosome modulation factor